MLQSMSSTPLVSQFETRAQTRDTITGFLSERWLIDRQDVAIEVAGGAVQRTFSVCCLQLFLFRFRVLATRPILLRFSPLPRFACSTMASPAQCLGCDARKKSGERFYDINSLDQLNRLRTRPNKRTRVDLEELDELAPDSKICKLCYNVLAYTPVARIIHDDTPDLSFYRQAPFSHDGCVFTCKSPIDLVSVSPIQRFKLLMEYKVYTKAKSRMCRSHVLEENWWPRVKHIETPVVDFKKVADLMFELHHKFASGQPTTHFDAKNPDSDWIDDESFQKWTGHTKEEFGTICSYAPSCEPVHVAVFLVKLRTSLANCQIATLFGISKSTVADYIAKCRGDLLVNAVPVFLNNHSRATLASHITPIARGLFDVADGTVFIVWDGGYRYMQKSANFAGQREFWSCQKKLALDKVMLGACPDGFIAYLFGPYAAKDNDATILEDCFERFPELATLQPNDIMMADRGFRDVVDDMESRGFTMLIPKGTGPSQVETLVANHNRFVTKNRWIVESTFGRAKKKYRFVALPAHNGSLKHDYEVVQIVFALLNMFHTPIESDVGRQVDIIRTMKARMHVPNRLQRLVHDLKLNTKRVIFRDVVVEELSDEQLVPLEDPTVRVMRFPTLSEDDLYMISCGTYQRANCEGYYAEHTATNGGIFNVLRFDPPARSPFRIDYANWDIEVEQPMLFKAKMASRFRSAQHHYQFVVTDGSKTGRDAIIELYCTCESGARTVGCCSHIMCILWYMGLAHASPISIPNPGILNISHKTR